MEEIDLDTSSSFDLASWIESSEAKDLQRDLEERILSLLFQNGETEFLQMAAQLAFLGTAPSSRPLLLREIAQLQVAPTGEIVHCGWSLKKSLERNLQRSF